MPRWLKRTALLILVPVLALAATAACGGDDDDDGDTTPSATRAGTTPAAGTPTTAAAIDISSVEELKDGVLNIGSDIAYAPIEFLDETTNQPVGLDIDLANALAKELGVRAEFTNGGFDGLIPALLSDRHDALFSAMSVNPERSAQVDFVEYFNAGSGVIVPSGNPKNVRSSADLCGLKVAVQEGTVQVALLGSLDTTCKDDGKSGITVLRFPTDPEAVLALRSGQADAEIADFPVAAYSAQQAEGQLTVVPNQIEPAPYGIAVRKSSALRKALQDALDRIMANGTYTEILRKWNLEAGAVS